MHLDFLVNGELACQAPETGRAWFATLSYSTAKALCSIFETVPLMPLLRNLND